MRILGIDPGIGRTGWGVIDIVSGKVRMIASGCIETKPNSEIGGRLYALYDEMTNLLKEYRPESFAIEELFFNKNVKTALVVGQARGVILLSAAQYSLPVGIYTPLQVKMALTGYGRAEKNQVGNMVKTVLHLTTVPKPDDAADALAIALTHAFSKKFTK